jgi:hypothetical protein
MGHTTTVTLMKARGADTSAMAGVWDNSVQWGNFMGVSSNLRYQLVNGWEARLLPLLKVLSVRVFRGQNSSGHKPFPSTAVGRCPSQGYVASRKR